MLKEFGRRLTSFRITSGKSISEIAEILHVSKALYYRYENGEAKPDVENLSDMCKVFSCTANNLFGHDTDASQLSVQAIKAARIIDRMPDNKKKLMVYILKGLLLQINARDLIEVSNEKEIDDAIRDLGAN